MNNPVQIKCCLPVAFIIFSAKPASLVGNHSLDLTETSGESHFEQE